jgi:hypothetical protein
MSNSKRFCDLDTLTTRHLPAITGYQIGPVLSLEQATTPLSTLMPNLHLFVKDARKYCSKNGKHGLTREESAAIYLYTMETNEGEDSFYSILNKMLRNEDRKQLKPFFPYLRLYASGVTKLPPLRTNAWRGVNKDLSHLFKKGAVLTWWSISSCSMSVDVIKDFTGNSSQGCTLFLIECLNAKKISDYTCFPKENEIILMPGTQLQVVSNSLGLNGGNHVVHLKEVADGEADDEEVQGAVTSVTKKFSETSLASALSNSVVEKRSKQVKTITFPNGNRYIGEVNEREEPEGYGTKWFAEEQFKSDRYEGHWQAGLQDGRGVYYYAAGGKYDGEWRNNQANGQGIMYFHNVDEYDGHWLNDEKEGYGVFSFKNGARYEGMFRNDSFNGHGAYTWPNGQKHEGEFKDNRAHGHGLRTSRDSTSIKGMWKHGEEC